MIIHFAGLARNCAESIKKNINKLTKISNKKEVSSCKIWIAENDSNDGTSSILKKYEKQEDGMELINFDGLYKKIENRVKRISFLRNEILEKIKKSVKNKNKDEVLYCPVDLDSHIASSINTNVFISECERVLRGKSNAIFPVSKPYYYDIYALRKKGWVEKNCLEGIGGNATNVFSFWSKYKNIYRKQKPVKEVTKKGRLKVDSAFGGVGIYRFIAVENSSYKVEEIKKDIQKDEIVCEHVTFNKQMDGKEISNRLIVRAPNEHISFKLKSRHEKFMFLSHLLMGDIKKAIKNILEMVNIGSVKC